MDKRLLQQYVRRQGGVEIASLQAELGVTYAEARHAVEEMVREGKLVYDSGLRYKLTEAQAEESTAEDVREEARLQSNRRTWESFLKRKLSEEADVKKEETKKKASGRLTPDDNRAKALECCLRRGEASVSLLQRNLPLSYVAARNIIAWMKAEGYISPFDDGTVGRYKVNITWREFIEKLGWVSGKGGDYPGGARPETEAEEGGVAAPCVGELESKTESVGRLARVLNSIKLKKQQPITADVCPCSTLWENQNVFIISVWDRIEELIRSDLEMLRPQALAKAEAYLHAVRDTHDGKMMQLYERMVYELKRMGDYEYYVTRKKVGKS